MNFFNRKCFSVLIMLTLFISGNQLFAQDLIKRNDLSQVKVDQLTDADITKFKQQLQSSGMTMDQAEQLALAKGMPAVEIGKLKQRMQLLSSSSASGTKNSSGGRVTDKESKQSDSTQLPRAEKKPLIDPRIFGSELFNTTSSFEPNLKIATPVNYELGPGDQLQITVFGVQEVNHDLTVSPEGSISIPNVGQIKVSGMTIEAATQRIRQVMGNTVYPTLKSGSSKLSITLGDIRSIHVTIIGGNKPGSYVLSSLSNVLTALYQCGGPSQFGSFRQIELIRNGSVERKIDLYRFLLNGDQSDFVRLKDNDVIRIPTYTKRVEIIGQVKRPGIFELLPEENFNNLLGYASGFTDSAYRASVKVTQLTDKEISVKDIDSKSYSVYVPQSGDFFNVTKILNRYQNRVNIIGAVFRPGYFQLTDGLTVSDLIRKAEGLKEDAYTQRGQVIRLKEDLTREVISFNIQGALNNNPADNIKLKREDEVVITSIFDLKDQYKISIQGEVRVPGEYLYADNLSLVDLVIQAGGFTDAAMPQRIEVARLLKRDSLTKEDLRASEIFDVNNGNDLAAASQNFELYPFDVITVRRLPGYLPLQSVKVAGQVQFPGPYVIANRSERVSNLVKRSGGFTPEANVDGAYLLRYISEEERKLKIERAQKMEMNQRDHDSSNKILDEVAQSYDRIPLDMKSIMASPGSIQDIVLKERDELYIPRFDAQVRVTGSVLMPTQIPYTKGNLKKYVSAAGGFAQNAARSKAYVVYANGRAEATSHFLFFKSYPSVKPGAEVIVPYKQERRNKLSTGELIGMGSALAAIATAIMGIISLSK